MGNIIVFGHFWHICQKNKDFGGVIAQNSTVFNGYCKVMFWIFWTANNWLSSLYTVVLPQSTSKHFAHHSISAGYFCKDSQTFPCFGTFGCKWACLIMKSLLNRKFDTYWQTLMYRGQGTPSWGSSHPSRDNSRSWSLWDFLEDLTEGQGTIGAVRMADYT